MSDLADDNYRWAWALIDAFAAHGAREAVISPGSRSTPLALACERHPALRTHVAVDERCAGFFALGLARAGGRPVLLVCTSGTAPAHWYPAVIEASESAVPLLLLSADRPPELHGCGANQTIDQRRLFGVHVRAFHDLPTADEAGPAAAEPLAARAWEQSVGLRPGPVHLNVPFREPLVPAVLETPPPRPAQPPPPSPARTPTAAAVTALARAVAGRRGVIVCGWGAGEGDLATAVGALGEQLRCPVLADPLSGLRFGAHARGAVMSRYDTFLRGAGFAAEHPPEWVLRLGAMPVSKVLAGYLATCPASDFVLVEPGGRRLDPLQRATELLACDAAALCQALATAAPAPAPADWLEGFIAAEARAGACTALPPEGRIVQSLVQRLPEGSLLFSGNSMPIRDLDSFSGSGPKALRIVANRGVSGIDGNISTLAGLAAAHRGRSAGLIGDLAFYHDMNGLLAAREQDLVLVVVNNGGGGIFGYLPQAQLAGFERDWLTPTGLDLGQAARLYGIPYQRVEGAGGFGAALADALGRAGPALIDVIIDRTASLAAHRHYWAVAAR